MPTDKHGALEAVLSSGDKAAVRGAPPHRAALRGAAAEHRRRHARPGGDAAEQPVDAPPARGRARRLAARLVGRRVVRHGLRARKGEVQRAAQPAALAARDRAAFGAVGPPKPNPNGFDRSIAWCTQQWGDDMKALGEHMLERYQADPIDASAATTLGNLMVRAPKGRGVRRWLRSQPPSVLATRSTSIVDKHL